MKIFFKANELLHCLSAVVNTSESSHDDYSFCHIAFTSANESETCNVSFTTTSQDATSKAQMVTKCHHFSETDIFLNTKDFFNVIRKLEKNAEISLEIIMENNTKIALIKSLKAKFKMQCPENVPTSYFQVKDLSDCQEVILSRNELLESINSIKFAIFKDPTRFNINGMLLQGVSNVGIKLCATNGQVLALKEISNNSVTNDFKVTIPKNSVSEIAKQLQFYKNENVKIEITKTLVRFYLENFTFTTKVIDASFPEYERVIPNRNNDILRVHRLNFLDGVNIADSLNVDTVKINITNTEIEFISSDSSKKEGKSFLECAFDGENKNFEIFYPYIKDTLTAIKAESITLHFPCKSGTIQEPIIIRPENNLTSLYIVMPKRT
jgi:DNA polymerase-3 subunit beta